MSEMEGAHVMCNKEKGSYNIAWSVIQETEE